VQTTLDGNFVCFQLKTVIFIVLADFFTIAIRDWTCPECGLVDPETIVGNLNGSPRGISKIEDSPTQRNSTPKVVPDLTPTQIGTTKSDVAHSVLNQPALDDEAINGSRLLRKRKMSSAEIDDNIHAATPNLKRRRNNHVSIEHEDSTRNDSNVDSDLTIGLPKRSRTLRLKPSRKGVSVERGLKSIIVKFHTKPDTLQQLLAQKAQDSKKRLNKGTIPRILNRNPSGISSAGLLSQTAPLSSNFSQPFYSFFDRETDELKGKPYGGILTEPEADTSKTLPANDDRRRFDEAKQKAEDEWKARLLEMQGLLETPHRKPKKSTGPASQIECIEFGGWEIDTWYAAPYPEEYSRNRVLYICEFCLKYMNSDYVAWRHKLKCPAKHPPGDEIYRHDSVSVFEVDGRKNPVYCQNLCLLAKLFLGSKTLYYDVEPFLFYVLCEYDDLGYHFVGYFSKEKRASSQNNVSCILTLPIHQRKGYGNLLIDFSYLLTKVEKKTGSPEKPLSDMGLVSYRNYWRLVMCRYLLRSIDSADTAIGLSIRQISDDTGLTPDDVISALEGLRCLVRDPETDLYAFRVDLPYCEEYVAKWEAKNYVALNPHALTWTPYVMGRSSATNFELGPAISAIAPREGDDETRNLPAQLDIASAEEAGGNFDQVDNTLAGIVNKSMDSKGLMIEAKPSDGTSFVEIADHSLPDTSTEPEVVADLHGMTDEWMLPYKSIPPTRFQIFPPVVGGRRLDRSRSTLTRPSVLRTGSAQPRPKRLTGSARRTSNSRPKTGSSRRKSGGTGRGPGRWPKGTKKSDYGNADSGPGLPPAWIRERARLAAISGSNGPSSRTNNYDQFKDVVQVQLESPELLRDGGGMESVDDSGHRAELMDSSNMPPKTQVDDSLFKSHVKGVENGSSDQSIHDDLDADGEFE
jgi:histone acetyltransferase SAS3